MGRDASLDALVSKMFVTERSNGLRHLVWHLVRDDEVVDDVLQETFATAIERPPRDPQHLGAWLTTVAKNCVRLRFRALDRRRRRERSVARSPFVAAGRDQVEGDEIRGLVSSAVQALGEPSRSTLLALFYRGLSVKELANQVGVCPSTIRARRCRALSALRSELDSKHPFERREWIAGMALWLRHDLAGTPLAAPSIGSGASTTTGNGASMGRDPSAGSNATAGRRGTARHRVRRSAAILLIGSMLIVGFLWRPGAVPGSPTTEAPRVTTELQAATDPSPLRSTLPPSLSVDPSTVSTDGAADHITVRIIDGDTGVLIPNATLYVDATSDGATGLAGRSNDFGTPPWLGWMTTEFLPRSFCERRESFLAEVDPRFERVGTTNTEGEIHTSRVDVGMGRLIVRAHGYSEYREPARFRFAVSIPALVGEFDRERSAKIYGIALDPSEFSTVRVKSADGRPLSGIGVALRGSGGRTRIYRTDDRGSVIFDWQDRDYLVTVNAEGYVPHRRLATGPVHDVRLVSGEPGSGRVIDGAGRGVAGATVSFLLCGVFEASIDRRTDEDGGFETPNLPSAGRVEIEIRHSNHPTLRAYRTLPWNDRETYQLRAGAWVEGRIDPGRFDGADTRVLLFAPARPELSRDLRPVSVDADGHFRVGPVAPGRWSLFIEHPVAMNEERPLGELTSGAVAYVDAVLREGASVAGRVVDTAGRPVSGVVLQVGSVLGEALFGPMTTTDENGGFVFSGLPVTPPRAYPFKKEARWSALTETDNAALSGLLLQVSAPHELVAKESSTIPRGAVQGSRNTCRVEPDERGVLLTLEVPRVTRPFAMDLRDETGASIRAATNLILVPPSDVENHEVVFSGTISTALFDLQGAGSDRPICAVWTLEYAVAFLQLDPDLYSCCAPRPVRLEAREFRRILVADADGVPVTNCPLLVEPVFDDSPGACAFYVGETRDDGRLLIDWLASGTYRLRVPIRAADYEHLSSAPIFRTMYTLDQTMLIGTLRLDRFGDGELMMRVDSEVAVAFDPKH